MKRKPEILLVVPNYTHSVYTTEPVLMYEAIAPDYGVIGDGEVTAPDLIGHIIEPKGELPGTVYRDSGKTVIAASREPNMDLDKIDFPNLDTLDANLVVIGSFIFGDTKETLQTVNETLTYWRNQCEGQVGIGLIQLYPRALQKMPFLLEAMLHCRGYSRRFWAVPPFMRMIYNLLGFRLVFQILVHGGLLKKAS